VAAELRYKGEWLIPLQQGYRVSSGYSASLAGGYPTSALRRQAVTVAASYRLKDAAMIAWWWALYEAGAGGRWSVALDTTGWLSVHDCAIVEPPQFTEYAGHTAVVTLSLSARTAGAESLIPNLVITIDEYDFVVT
jgi:hypothetical protein